MTACPRRICECARPSSPDQSLTLPELRPTFGRKLLDRERGSARHCGLNLLAHLSLGRSGTPLRGGGVLFRHAASLSGMSQLTACAISTSQGTRSGSGRGMRPSANALASSMRFWGKVQGAGRCGCGWRKAPRTRSAGQEGLRYHFEIANAYTDHTLQVGSHCILQFNLTVYDEDGWRLSPKDARKKLVRLTKQLRLESCIRALEKLARVE